MVETDARLDAHERLAGIGSWEWNTATNDFHASPNLFRLLGYEPSAIPEARQIFHEHIHPDDLEVANERLARAVAENASGSYEIRVRMLGGAWHWVRVSLSGKRDADGNMIVFGVAQETTDQHALTASLLQEIDDRRRVENKLKTSEEKYRDLFENTLDLVQFVAMDERLIDTNPAWLRSLGYGWEDARPLFIEDVVHPRSLEHYRSVQRRVIENRATESLEFQYITRDGEAIIVEGNLGCKFDGDMLLYTRGTFTNITARKRTEADLMHSVQRLADSEVQMQNIFDNAPDAVVLIDNMGKVVKWNPKAAMIFGWTVNEIVGQPLHEFIIPEQFRDAFVEGMARYWDTGESKILNTTVQVNAVTKAGDELDVDLSIAPTVINRELFFIGFARDVTDRNRNRHALQLSEERFRLLVSAVKDYAIFMLEPNGIVASWNAGAERINGYKADEIIGKHFSIFYPPKDFAKPPMELEVATRDGRYEEEGWRVRKDGTRFWSNVVITAVYNDAGQLVGFAKVTRDLTERQRAMEELRKLNEMLRRSNEYLQSFAYVASHDLKEPMRKIQIFCDRIAEKEARHLSESGLDWFRRIGGAAARMTMLIEDLLAFSRVSYSDNPFEPVDLQALFENVKNDLSEEIKGADATVTADALPIIHGVPVQLRQLFQNLIANGLKFHKPGIPAHVSITHQIVTGKATGFAGAEPRRHYLKLVFRDQGIGFQQQYADRIFEMFQRLHDRKSYAGTGIGLALCKKVAENHGGWITAHGEVGVGAEFTVYLAM